MKDNVDLTVDQDFSRPHRRLPRAPLTLLTQSPMDLSMDLLINESPEVARVLRYPWLRNEIHDDSELLYVEHDPSEDLVYTGVKERRATLREQYGVDHMQICYRCGKPIEPYMQFRIDSCLCKVCYKTCESEMNTRIPWKPNSRF